MTPASESPLLAEAAADLRGRLSPERWAAIRLGMVLGSGLKEFAGKLEDVVEVPLAEVKHWPAPQVEGHGGALVVGRVGGIDVACLTGRVHLYEGYSPHEVVRAVRTLRTLGVPAFLLSNAAGGIGDKLVAGDLMVITDHLNLTGASPLSGPHEQDLGARFVDQSAVWDPHLSQLLKDCDLDLRHGVYAGLPGPTYETPAEVRMLRVMGAAAVGMSTVLEASALHAMGARVCGLSMISNLASGRSPVPLSHREVIETGKQAAARLNKLVVSFCRKLSSENTD